MGNLSFVMSGGGGMAWLSGQFTNYNSKTTTVCLTHFVLAVLRRFDAYPKPLEDFRVKTKFGGAMSLICVVIMFVLFGSEIR